VRKIMPILRVNGEDERRRTAWGLAAILAVALLRGTDAQAKKLYPVDEAPRDRSFRVFRRELIRAAQRRDRRFLISHLAPQIMVDPFAERPLRGIKAFEAEWRPQDPQSGLWKELIQVLSLGGSFQRVGTTTGRRTRYVREFVAPYVTSRWPENLDSMEYQAVIARDVRVRLRPNATAPVVDTVSYDILKVDWKASEATDWDWIRVTTPRGQRGYVAGHLIRSAGESAAHFIKLEGRWVIAGLYETQGE